ncbi:hypothetical protein [Desulfolutivibrio sp.]|uniref:hypothetical protein n=1 Tax=Desulfolutivibrio sp. TaxID=2773296 RepID=UPI002F964135
MKSSGRFSLALGRETLSCHPRLMSARRVHPRPGQPAMPHGAPGVAPVCARARR